MRLLLLYLHLGSSSSSFFPTTSMHYTHTHTQPLAASLIPLTPTLGLPLLSSVISVSSDATRMRLFIIIWARLGGGLWMAVKVNCSS